MERLEEWLLGEPIRSLAVSCSDPLDRSSDGNSPLGKINIAPPKTTYFTHTQTRVQAQEYTE